MALQSGFPYPCCVCFCQNNIILNLSLDKIYYPLLPVFQKYRKLEKKDGFSDAVNDPYLQFQQTSEQKVYESKSHMRGENFEKIMNIDNEILEERK